MSEQQVARRQPATADGNDKLCDLMVQVDGTEDEPITIRNELGTSAEDCVLRGDDRSRVLEVLHNHYIIQVGG